MGASAVALVALPASAAGADTIAQQAIDLLLASALGAERTSARACTQLADSVFAGARTRSALQRCASQNRTREHLLRRELASAGMAVAPAPPPAPLELGVGSEGAILTLAIGLEQAALRAYLAIVRPVSQTPLLRAIGGAVAAHGQQLTVLREVAGLPPVPRAFENGSAAT